MDCQPTHTSPHVVRWETLDDITSPSLGLPDDNFFRWSDALLLSSWLEFGLLGKKHLDPNYVVFIILGSLNCIYPSDGAFMPLKREVESTKLDFRGLSMWQQQFNLGLIGLLTQHWAWSFVCRLPPHFTLMKYVVSGLLFTSHLIGVVYLLSGAQPSSFQPWRRCKPPAGQAVRGVCFHSGDCRSLFIRQRAVPLSTRGVSSPRCKATIPGIAPEAFFGGAFPSPHLAPALTLSVFKFSVAVLQSEELQSLVHRLPEVDLIHMAKNISSSIIAGSVRLSAWVVFHILSLSKLGQASSLLGYYLQYGSHSDSKGHCTARV